MIVHEGSELPKELDGLLILGGGINKGKLSKTSKICANIGARIVNELRPKIVIASGGRSPYQVKHGIFPKFNESEAILKRLTKKLPNDVPSETFLAKEETSTDIIDRIVSSANILHAVLGYISNLDLSTDTEDYETKIGTLGILTGRAQSSFGIPKTLAEIILPDYEIISLETLEPKPTTQSIVKEQLAALVIKDIISGVKPGDITSVIQRQKEFNEQVSIYTAPTVSSQP